MFGPAPDVDVEDSEDRLPFAQVPLGIAVDDDDLGMAFGQMHGHREAGDTQAGDDDGETVQALGRSVQGCWDALGVRVVDRLPAFGVQGQVGCRRG